MQDPYENMGAQLVKEVASKTNDIAGDGTTTAIVLAQSLLNEGIKNVTAGANAKGIERGMHKALEVVEGMQFDRGYISPYFITDSERMEAVLEDCYVIITDKKISAMNDILPLRE